MEHATIIEKALDNVDRLSTFARERVMYAAEQLLAGDREDADNRIFVQVIEQACR